MPASSLFASKVELLCDVPLAYIQVKGPISRGSIVASVWNGGSSHASWVGWCERFAKDIGRH